MSSLSLIFVNIYVSPEVDASNIFQTSFDKQQQKIGNAEEDSKDLVVTLHRVRVLKKAWSFTSKDKTMSPLCGKLSKLSQKIARNLGILTATAHQINKKIQRVSARKAQGQNMTLNVTCDPSGSVALKKTTMSVNTTCRSFSEFKFRLHHAMCEPQINNILRGR